MVDPAVHRQLAYAFQICTSRQPTDTERNALRNLYSETLSAAQNSKPRVDQQSAEAKAWYSVATVLLNLHETITKD